MFANVANTSRRNKQPHGHQASSILGFLCGGPPIPTHVYKDSIPRGSMCRVFSHLQTQSVWVIADSQSKCWPRFLSFILKKYNPRDLDSQCACCTRVCLTRATDHCSHWPKRCGKLFESDMHHHKNLHRSHTPLQGGYPNKWNGCSRILMSETPNDMPWRRIDILWVPVRAIKKQNDDRSEWTPWRNG